MTPAPTEAPWLKAMSRLISDVLALTAARALLPTDCPTMMESAVLYICWKKVPSRMGKKKYRSCFQITPSVMPLTAAISLFSSIFLYFPIKTPGPVFGPHLF